MKHFLVFIFAIISVQVNAQKVAVPKIVIKQSLGEEIKLNTTSIKLVNVINDSRCPKNALCVRGGEVNVLVQVTTKNEEPFIKELTIPANLSSNYKTLIYNDNKQSIYALNVWPYPEIGKTILAKNYYLTLVLQ